MYIYSFNFRYRLSQLFQNIPKMADDLYMKIYMRVCFLCVYT